MLRFGFWVWGFFSFCCLFVFWLVLVGFFGFFSFFFPGVIAFEHIWKNPQTVKIITELPPDYLQLSWKQCIIPCTFAPALYDSTVPLMLDFQWVTLLLWWNVFERWVHRREFSSPTVTKWNFKRKKRMEAAWSLHLGKALFHSNAWQFLA